MYDMLALKVHLVAGLIYGLDFDRIQSTLGSPGIRNVRPTVWILHLGPRNMILCLQQV
jgi:hypothetical protein